MDEILEKDEEKIKYKLENFEGPLDLLLHLIKENKMEIETVKLSEITSQFLAYIENVNELDMEKASEFIEMAATLIEIKSKALLPKPEVVVPEEDTEAILKRRLEEYKIFKEQSQQMQSMENVDRFYKEPDSGAHDVRIVFSDFNMDALVEAFSHVMHKIEVKAEPNVARTITNDRFTVKDKIHNIRQVLADRKQVKFTELFDEGYSKIEIITTFMALLELLKMQKVKVEQQGMFNEIDIKINEDEFYKNSSNEIDRISNEYGEE